jgi:hypothetical protein
MQGVVAPSAGYTKGAFHHPFFPAQISTTRFEALLALHLLSSHHHSTPPPLFLSAHRPKKSPPQLLAKGPKFSLKPLKSHFLPASGCVPLNGGTGWFLNSNGQMGINPKVMGIIGR